MKIKKSLATIASVFALLSAGMGGAHAVPSSPQVIGGNEASNPWVVQLTFKDFRQSGTYGCTGEQLNEEWILTAKHCTANSYDMKVYQSNDQENPGTPVRADRLYNSPLGDIALIHLAKDAPLSSYADLDLNYRVRAGQQGYIFGYGLGANSTPTDTLRSAQVRVIGSSFDAFFGRAAHIRGITGASNHGDSGGPLVINGRVVAVCSTGDQADPGANLNAQSNYAVLSQTATWIESTTGLDY